MTLIIGGGGAGLDYAYLAKTRHPESEVTVIEEHTETGKPVQCTGILTNEIEKLMTPEEIRKITLNKITKTKVFSPNNHVTIPISTNYIICNVTFIKHLSQKADKAGVNIMEGYRYQGNNGQKTTIRDLKTKELLELKTNKLIGADGPSSQVARSNNLYGKREFLTGVQARVEIDGFDPSQIDFYPHIGEYAWFTPESDKIARIGVAARKNAKQIFDDFIKKYPGKIIEMQGGPIPLHKPNTKILSKTKNHTVALLGDAALQIKNTTGGGIIPGMKAAKALAEGTDTYQKNLKSLNKELYIHYILNKAFGKYTGKDWDSLVRKAGNPKIQEILQKTNRDNATKMLLKLATQPSMITEGIKAVRKTLIKTTIQ